MNVVFLAGSPGTPSRVATLCEYLAQRLAAAHAETQIFAIDTFVPEALVYGHTDAPAIRYFLDAVANADALVVATPVYQSSFSGALKLLLDLIPQNGLRGKVVLPLAAGGSPGHLLALDYALKPVLAALGADSVLAGVYASGDDLKRHGGGYNIQNTILTRLDDAADELIDRLWPIRTPRALAVNAKAASRPRLFADDGSNPANFRRRSAAGA